MTNIEITIKEISNGYLMEYRLPDNPTDNSCQWYVKDTENMIGMLETLVKTHFKNKVSPDEM